MTEVAERLRTASHARSRVLRVLAIAILLLAVLGATAIAAPRLLDPLCGDWPGAPAFRWARRAARAAHAAVFGATIEKATEKPTEKASDKPAARPHERR